ncbi:MAG: hypothetical protein HC841_01400 [Verrucomicrobiae bacterium]|nr:hypothetical protein [Verrucomicrobiae bacterium]
MQIHFGQIYIEAGVSFPFSLLFQRRLSDEVNALIIPSTLFVKKYGEDWDLMFRISAKAAIQETEIRGPSVFKKGKDVEYTIFLPFTVIRDSQDTLRTAIEYLFDAIVSVLTKLEFSTGRLIARRGALVDSICSDPTMLNHR